MLRRLSPIMASIMAIFLVGGVAWAAVESPTPAAPVDETMVTMTVATDVTSTSEATATTAGQATSSTVVDDTTSTSVADSTPTTVADSTPTTTPGEDSTTTSSVPDEGTSTTIDGGDDVIVGLEAGTYDFALSNGGSVSVTIENRVIAGFTVVTPDGWTYDVEKSSFDRLRIEFSNGDNDIEIEIRVRDAGLEVDIDD